MRACLIALMLVGCTADGPIYLSPGSRDVVDVVDSSGIAIAVDRRLYADKPFELRLPRGRYLYVELTREEIEGELLVTKTKVLADATHPALQREQPLPIEAVVRPGRWVVRVKATDGREGQLTFEVRRIQAEVFE